MALSGSHIAEAMAQFRTGSNLVRLGNNGRGYSSKMLCAQIENASCRYTRRLCMHVLHAREKRRGQQRLSKLVEFIEIEDERGGCFYIALVLHIHLYNKMSLDQSVLLFYIIYSNSVAMSFDCKLHPTLSSGPTFNCQENIIIITIIFMDHCLPMSYCPFPISSHQLLSGLCTIVT
jgi:hypothetical protein